MGVQRRTATAPSADDYAPDREAGLSAETEDDRPTRSSSVTKRGWGAAKQAFKATANSYADDFKVGEVESLAKFMEDEPFTVVLVHWVDEITEGKRSFYCIAEVDDEGCPLDAVGHKPKAEAWFNVVPLVDADGAAKPEVRVLKAGPMLAGILEKENDGRGGPLSRHFWSMSRSGGGKKGGKVNYSVKTVKERDLADDWELDPTTVTSALADLKPYDETIVRYPSREDLEEIVQAHLLD